MDMLNSIFTFYFPVSGVETNVFVPLSAAFIISFFTSSAGVSGAFLLMPFQVSALGYATPSASGTNLVYNILAIPGGVYRYFKEGRMLWPLSAVVIAGTVPGSLIGFYLRVYLLDDAAVFKLFAGFVLLYIAYRIAYDVCKRRSVCQAALSQDSSRCISGCSVSIDSADLSEVRFSFNGSGYSFSVPGLFIISVLVGIAGGAYGVGGGAIISPFCMAVYGLPVYVVAGAALFATFITSIAGAFFYAFAPVSASVHVEPDLALGALFGVGGFFGVYLGARMQKHLPEKPIKIFLFVVLAATGAAYIAGYFI